MTNVSARSNLVNLSLEKNLTSNRPKPIRVLTRTKPSCSDDRLPLGYLLPDFQPHRSNFLALPPPPALTRMKGVDTEKKTMPIRLLDPSEFFTTTKLPAIWFIVNFDQFLIDSCEEEKIARYLTSNHCMPMGVLIHKNSLVSKESYRKVFHRTRANFDLVTSHGPGL